MRELGCDTQCVQRAGHCHKRIGQRRRTQDIERVVLGLLAKRFERETLILLDLLGLVVVRHGWRVGAFGAG